MAIKLKAPPRHALGSRGMGPVELWVCCTDGVPLRRSLLCQRVQQPDQKHKNPKKNVVTAQEDLTKRLIVHIMLSTDPVRIRQYNDVYITLCDNTGRIKKGEGDLVDGF